MFGTLLSPLKALGRELKKPYDAATAANQQAGQQMDDLGRETYGLSEAGLGRALDQTTPAARQWRKTYETGEMAGPGALERYYEERRSGVSPDQLRSRELGTKGLNDAFAARGGFNSGAAIKAIGNLHADLGAKESAQMGDLAAGAQGAQETRLGGAFDRLSGLGMGRAGLVQRGTESGIQNMVAGRLGGINANLAGANAQLQAYRDLYNTGGQIAGYGLGYGFGGR